MTPSLKVEVENTADVATELINNAQILEVAQDALANLDGPSLVTVLAEVSGRLLDLAQTLAATDMLRRPTA